MDHLDVEQACDLVDLFQPVAFSAYGGIDCGLRVLHGGRGGLGTIGFVCHRGLSSFVGVGGFYRRFCICSSGRHGGGRFCQRDIVGQLHAGHQPQRVALAGNRLAVGAGGNLQRLGIVQQFIGKAFLHGLFAGHVGSVCHHVQQHCLGEPGLAPIDGDLALIPGIVDIGGLAQILGIVRAPDERPTLVDHHKA